MYAVIRQRRAAADSAERRDVLSLLLEARDEDGQPLSDAELRDELMTLVLAGHETTANQLAWTLERLVRSPRRTGGCGRRSGPEPTIRPMRTSRRRSTRGCAPAR